MANKSNGTGSVRKLPDGKYECIVQSKYLNPKTAKPKRFKRISSTEKQAMESAQMAKLAWEKEYEAGRSTKINKSKTYGQYMEEFLESIKPTLTASGYHSYISAMRTNFYPFPIAKFQLQMLSKVEFEKYYNSIYEKKSRKTCSFPVQLNRRCCKWLVERSLLRENYAEQAQLPKEVADEYDLKKEELIKNKKKVFTPEDIQKFYYAYKQNMGQYPVVVLFLLETGLRANEFSALRNSSIDLEKRRINIVETQSIRFKDNDKDSGSVEFYTKVPKNAQSRFIMLSDLAYECVLYMMEQTKLNCPNNPDNILYPTFRNGKRRNISSMEVCFKELCDKLEIDRDVRITKTGQKKGLCLHSLRHTADTIANTAKGANVVNTALMMGHTAVRTENVYTHATEEALSSVTTVSQALLDDYKKPDSMTSQDFEDYKSYLKLRQKFESMN